MKIINNPLIGADVEVFLAERETMRIVSAEGYIQGTKNNPFVFDKDNPHFATSLDNVLAEFGIAPARTKAEFYNNLQKSLNYINATIPSDFCTAILPAANLEPEFLKTKQAKVFGCDPDFNAYTGLENLRPYCDDVTLRSCGGHIHISWDNVTPEEDYKQPKDETRRQLIKMLDFHIGVPSVLMEPENKRKELYGKAGSYRSKEYGVEYRTPSNYYLASKKLTDWIYTSALTAIQWINEGKTLDPYMDDVVQAAINFNSKEMAADLCKEYHLKVAV